MVMAGEMEVDGNLTVTDTIYVTTIQSATIDSLLSLIAQLEMRIAQLECQNTGIIPEGDCDCFFHTLDECNECGGDNEVFCYVDGTSCTLDTDCESDSCDLCDKCGSDNSCIPKLSSITPFDDNILPLYITNGSFTIYILY